MTEKDHRLADQKMRAEISHLIMQTARIQQQMRWQIPVYMVSFIGAIVAVLTFFGQ